MDLQKQYSGIKKEINAAVAAVLNSGKFILSSNVQMLENDAAHYLNMPYAVGVNSGTDALLFALKALGIGKGDEVITTPFTFVATLEAILHAGAVPVLVDIEESTYNMNVNLIEKHITKKTKALMPVHIFGQMVQMDAVLRLAKKYKLAVIEDMCQSFGAAYNGKKAGTYSEASCTSFFPSKNLGGYGDGGMIFLKDRNLCDIVKKMRAHGASDKGFYDFVAYNSRLDELQAAIVRVKLKYINTWNKKRWENAQLYKKHLRSLEPDIILPSEAENALHIYNLFVIRARQRDALFRTLLDSGVMAQIHYSVPCHLQKAFSRLRYKPGDFPVAEKCSNEVLSLPMFPELTEAQIKYVSRVIAKFIQSHGK